MLLGAQTGPRTFQCRFANVAQTEWSISFAPPESSALPEVAVSGYVLASGTESVTLDAVDLPFSPHPFEATLQVRTRDDDISVGWRIIVLPHPDDAFPSPPLGSEG